MSKETGPQLSDMEPADEVKLVKFREMLEMDMSRPERLWPFGHDGVATQGRGQIDWVVKFLFWYAALHGMTYVNDLDIERLDFFVDGVNKHVSVHVHDGLVFPDAEMDDYEMRNIIREMVKGDKRFTGQEEEVMFTAKISDWVVEIDPRCNN